MIPVLFGVSLVVFLSMHLIPGDPARLFAGPEATDEEVASIRQHLGLDRPLHEQYLVYMGRVLRGDLGRSVITTIPVASEIMAKLPATLQLALASMVVASILGLSAGIVSAIRQYSLLDNLLSVFSILAISMPVYWTGLIFMLIFAERLRWLPSAGRGTPLHLVMPAVTLGIWGAGDIARMTRATVVEALGEDYIRTAYAKGLSERVVVLRHVFRNAMIPVVTILGLQLGAFLSGTVITETVFSYPGVGRFMVNSIRYRDFPMVQGGALVLSVLFVTTTLLVDILYAYIDPRIHRV